METLGKITASLIMVVVGIIVNAFVLTKLWLWFIVAIFTLNPLTMVEAMGIALFTSYFSFTMAKVKEEVKVDAFTSLCFVLIKAGVCLLLGYTYYSLM